VIDFGIADGGLGGARRTGTVEIAALIISGSPRREAENAEHIRILAQVESGLPAILVHAPTMRVIDGVHRIGARLLQGRRSIEAEFFDGSEEDAFVLAVQANTSHGLPLSLADREAAAERILCSHSCRSDRAIAAVVGLSATTVALLRVRSTEECEQSNGRLGRDGRIRPITPQPGRLRAAEVVAAHPTASVREVAKLAAVSVGTAHDVIARISRGLDPLRTQRDDNPVETSACGDRDVLRKVQRDNWTEMAARYQLLCSDPSLRYTEQGRSLLRWLKQHMIEPSEWHAAVDAVPEHWASTVAELAKACAEEWQRVARTLGQCGQAEGACVTAPSATASRRRVRAR
jgi:transposase